MADMEAAGLTAREQEVLRLVSRGLTNEQIAERMGVTRKTVELRVAGIRERAGLPGGSSLRHAVLALQYKEIRELRAKLADVFEIEGAQ